MRAFFQGFIDLSSTDVNGSHTQQPLQEQPGLDKLERSHQLNSIHEYTYWRWFNVIAKIARYMLMWHSESVFEPCGGTGWNYFLVF